MIQQQWKAFTLDLHSDRAYENPFLNVDVTAVFTGPEGEILRVLGFWDGGGTWRIRAALTAVGQWRYSTCASDGNPDFSSEGSICCVAYDGELDIRSKLGEGSTFTVYLPILREKANADREA